ncbi:MAG: hypothetical protein QXE76_05660, partial [Candidatus Bathyarchaeia archaeon]
MFLHSLVFKHIQYAQKHNYYVKAISLLKPSASNSEPQNPNKPKKANLKKGKITAQSSCTVDFLLDGTSSLT